MNTFYFIFLLSFYKDLPLQGSAGKAHHILRRKELCPADTQFANPGVPSNIYSREPVNMITAPPLPPPATLCDWKGSRLRNIKKEKKEKKEYRERESQQMRGEYWRQV